MNRNNDFKSWLLLYSPGSLSALRDSVGRGLTAGFPDELYFNQFKGAWLCSLVMLLWWNGHWL